jgi:hypothetical protein
MCGGDWMWKWLRGQPGPQLHRRKRLCLALKRLVRHLTISSKRDLISSKRDLTSETCLASRKLVRADEITEFARTLFP